MDFDEQQAIDFMRAQFPQDWRDKYDDDELLNVIDIIWDYYEDHGMLDIDTALDDDDDQETDVPAIVEYVAAMLRKDKQSPIQPCHVAPIVEAELAYENSIGLTD